MRKERPEKPPVVTTEEEKKARELQLAYAKIDQHHFSLTYDELGDRWSRARESYRDNPTDECLAEMKRAALERSFFRAETRVRRWCREVLGEFVNAQVIPWATAILERNLKATRVAAEKVRAVENSRCLKLTGRPLVSSDIVAAAERPVRHIEVMRKGLSQRALNYMRSPDSFLRAFAAIGDANFENLVDDVFSPEQIDKMLAEERDRLAVEAEESSVFDDPVLKEGAQSSAEEGIAAAQENAG